MDKPKIATTTKQKLSPWVDLVTKVVIFPGYNEPQTYHSFAQVDYTNIVAITSDGWIPLVRQYRTAIDRHTLELPGGLCDPNEDPAAAATRELMEETGYCVSSSPIPLGCFYPDPGRLENRLWGFFAPVATESGTVLDDPGVERVLVSKDELVKLVLDGKIEHVGHVGLITLAILKGLL